MPTQQELENWKFNAIILIAEIELFDEGFRKRNPDHRCKDWYECEPGKWFCKHLEIARKRNKKLEKMELIQTLTSPYLKDPRILEVTEALYRLGKDGRVNVL